MIIEQFIPTEDSKKTERMSEWNDELNDWFLKKPESQTTQKKARPQSAVGMKRPTSEYTRIAKGLGDINPRFKVSKLIFNEISSTISFPWIWICPKEPLKIMKASLLRECKVQFLLF
jgi:hypothetical protein